MSYQNETHRLETCSVKDSRSFIRATDPNSNEEVKIPINTVAPPAITWAYGEISVEGNVTATTFGGSSADFSNASQVLVFNTNGVSLNTTPDHTEDHITIDLGGVYIVGFSGSISGGASSTISVAVFKNNKATKLTPRSSREIGAGGELDTDITQGIVSLNAGDTIEVWVQNETTTTEVVVQDAVLTVVKIS